MVDYFLLNKMSDYFFQISINIMILFNLIKICRFKNHFNLKNSFEMEFNHYNWVSFHYFSSQIIFHNEPIAQVFISKFDQLPNFCFIKYLFHQIFHQFLN